LKDARYGIACCLSALLATACFPSGPGEGPRPAQPPSFIDTLTIRAHTYFLSHDLLAGRGTGTPGADIAAVYLASACRELGLRPLGADFVQEVPLVEATLDSAVIAVRNDRSLRQFRYPGDFLPDFGGDRALIDFAGRAVYGGSPLRLGELGLVRGAVLVTTSPVEERARLDSLQARGAVALLQLVADSAIYDLYRRSRGTRRVAIAEPGIPTSLLPALPWIIGGPRLTRELTLAAGPLNGAADRPVTLGVTVELRLFLARHTIAARNVACLVEGSQAGARDTAIVLAAHYDHLGVGAPDARGDSIYNGFSDNAAGVGMVLAIARAMTRGAAAPMRHSIILLFPTAEERGLLGSDYYVARPLWPLARTLGVITLDAGAPPAPPTSWRIAGGDRSSLGTLAVDVALARGWSATTSPATPISDHYPFARSGVPAIFLIPGPGPYEGLSSDSSVALRRAWEHYHQPGDEWASNFPFRGLQRYAEYALLVARALDGGAVRGGKRR
jgi:hypothetical protein